VILIEEAWWHCLVLYFIGLLHAPPANLPGFAGSRPAPVRSARSEVQQARNILEWGFEIVFDGQNGK
jgi:hypothetical protein